MSIKRFQAFNNKKSYEEVIQHMDKMYPNEEKQKYEREGMLIAYKLLSSGEIPASEYIGDVMWKLYPSDEELPIRSGMLKAYEFWIGQYDEEEKFKQKIKQQISDKINKLYPKK